MDAAIPINIMDYTSACQAKLTLSEMADALGKHVAVCSLCRKPAVLCDSHIVPEFLYKQLYNDKRQLLGINGVGPRGGKFLQKGLREPLFCDRCEQHFNDHLEKPFLKQWIKRSPLPSSLAPGTFYEVNVDYASFKLFHLCVLFRAGVCSLQTFRDVSLGISHEERLRRMLLECKPGPPHRYPIWGYAVLHHRTNQLVPMVSRAQARRSNGYRCYGMMYGGVEWWISMSLHTRPKFEERVLQADGRVQILARDWREVHVIQEAGAALRGEFQTS